MFSDSQYPVHGVEHHVCSKPLLLYMLGYGQPGKLCSRGSDGVFLSILSRKPFHQDFTRRECVETEDFGRVLIVHQYKSARDALLTMLPSRVA